MIRRPPRSTLFPTRRSSDLNRDRLFNDLAAPGQDLLTTVSRASARSGLSRDAAPNDVVEPDGTVQGTSFAADRKSTRLNSSHSSISYAVFCLKKKKVEYIV